MNSKRAFLLCLVVLVQMFSPPWLRAFEPPPLVIDSLTVTGSTATLRFEQYPNAQGYTIYSGTNVGALSVNTNFFQAPYVIGYITNIIANTNQVITNFAYEWRLTNFTKPSAFFRVGVAPVSSNALLASTVLNRLAYGPTPDELERVTAIGPQAYIDEQVNMGGIPETMDNFTVQTMNAVYPSDPTTNWVYISMTGTLAQTTFYLFTTQPGEAYFDDIELRPFNYMLSITTNLSNGSLSTNRVISYLATNILANGDFESGYAPWNNLGGASGSGSDSSRAHGGSSCLHMVSTSGASGPGSSYVRQVFTNLLYMTTNTWGDTVFITNSTSASVVLSYWYLPTPTSTNLRLQLGSGLNSTPGGIPPPPTWVYTTATGTAGALSRIYLYLSTAGESYIDDVKLVAGSVPEAGPNLLTNGGFESTLTGSWTLQSFFTGSQISPNVAHSGSGSLRMVSTGAGGTNNGIYQTVSPSLINGQTYTLSYWYVPAAPGQPLTARLFGAGTNILVNTPDRDLPGLSRRLNTVQAGLDDYRAWWCLHAVQSQRQLFEILSQFWENHFVTQWSKSRDYLVNQGYDDTKASLMATDWEFREMTKWRNAMLNPNCTFYDLLKISAESPAQIVFLDSVNSTGNGNNVANENYARELLELYTMGVDNGYDQNDIVLMSRVWTGWSVQLVDEPNAANPFAPASITYYPGTNSTAKQNTIGVWAFNFKQAGHGTNRGAIFGGKTVPARFGPPWAGMPYQIALPSRGAVTNGIQDGYDVITKLANSPFAQEFISVKLCRLFVHDDFPNPTTFADQPAYAFYDYTDPNRSEEAELVHQCMLAWENSSPKGNLRAVLNTIFNSELFRTHAAAAQKVKTPLEFVASTVRALRSVNPNGTATAATDGYAFNSSDGYSPLTRMGLMELFDRAAPDGYSEYGPNWISAGTAVERIRFVQSFCLAPGQTGHNGGQSGTGNDAGNNVCDPVTLLMKKLPFASLTKAGDVADYFLGILYPGEGAGNLALYRAAAVNFLNTADNSTASLFINLTPSNAANSTYDNRVRGMVAMLMAMQRFQEQ